MTSGVLLKGAEIKRLEAQARMDAAQQQAMVNAEMRVNGARVFAAAIGPYLFQSAFAGTSVDPAVVRKAAGLAANASPYLSEAYGILQCDDEGWSK